MKNVTQAAENPTILSILIQTMNFYSFCGVIYSESLL